MLRFVPWPLDTVSICHVLFIVIGYMALKMRYALGNGHVCNMCFRAVALASCDLVGSAWVWEPGMLVVNECLLKIYAFLVESCTV